jgi:hypothetical protein
VLLARAGVGAGAGEAQHNNKMETVFFHFRNFILSPIFGGATDT